MGTDPVCSKGFFTPLEFLPEYETIRALTEINETAVNETVVNEISVNETDVSVVTRRNDTEEKMRF